MDAAESKEQETIKIEEIYDEFQIGGRVKYYLFCAVLIVFLTFFLFFIYSPLSPISQFPPFVQNVHFVFNSPQHPTFSQVTVILK